MLPDANHLPACSTKKTKVALVAGTIGTQLLPPEFGQLVLPRRQSPSVPEIPIHEDCNPIAWENDVGPTREATDVAMETEPFAPECFLYQPFQRTIFQLHARHRPRTFLWWHVIGRHMRSA